MEDASEHTSERESSHWVVALEPSCWSIPLVVDEHSRAATVLLVLLFLANLALQLVFCFVVYWKLGASAGEEKKNIYGEQTVKEAYMTLPPSLCAPSIAESCLACFDYTNGLAVRRAPQRPPRFACPGVPRALCPS